MDMATLGGRLRSRRIERGLTIAAVAQEAGLSMPYVANLERGRGNPTLDALANIARALDAPLAALVGAEEAKELEGPDAALAALPRSLVDFSRIERFRSEASRLAESQGVPVDEMRRRLLAGMASAPRRSDGEPTVADWNRLLDTYVMILR